MQLKFDFKDVFRPKLLDCLRNYSRKLLFQDATAGLIVGVVAIPLAIAFGISSGVGPAEGLITAIIAGFIISFFGGSKVQIGGPTGAFIIIIYSINKGLKILSASGSVLTPSVGDLITVNLATGVVFSASNGSFKAVSVTEGASLRWSTINTTTSATDQNNGANNMAKIKALSDWETTYPAFKWCSDYGLDWYLPARNELKTIYNNKSTINSTLSANGGTTLGAEYYWSSTEQSKGNAVRIDFSEDYTGYWSKDTSYKVRAVLAF